MPAPADPAVESLEQRVLGAALELGFVRAGIAPATRSERAAEHLTRWLEAGHHGEMGYMTGGLDRASPSALLPEVKSVLVVALPYGNSLTQLRRHRTGPALPIGSGSSPAALPIGSGSSPAAPPALTGIVARYARGEDYHRVLKDKLRRLGLAIEALMGRPVGQRACVDSAPLLERDFAVRAGLGFAAKSTLTILPGAGSFVLLGELLLDLELTPTAPRASSGSSISDSVSVSDSSGISDSSEAGCGSCSACLTACPTGAFVGPHQLDARRCISYLTIELKGAIPRELRPLIGRHVFGCDICQDVCPWNRTRHAPSRDSELGERPALADPDLVSLLFLTSSGYRKLVQGTALSRVSRARLARNAAVALGNSHDARAEQPLATALATHPHELVRAHAAWALAALGVPLSAGRAALELASRQDASEQVREEAQLALSLL